jgi:antitoxin component YwqK of YwqJK toxin-antitoxin module
MKRFITGLFIWMAALSVHAQELQISDIEMLNLGDGRVFAHERKDEKPIDGRVRIITGYTTEYIDAGFDKGYADGKWEYYRYNKLSETINYSQGYLNGEKLSYYNDGTTVHEKVVIKNGKADGTIVRYSSEGKIEYEKGMKEGIDEGPERSYDESGKVISEIIYKNGKAEGKSFASYNRGSSDAYLRTSYYKKGILEGEYSEIYDNGTVKIKGKYLNGQKEGVWETNKEDGSKKPTEEYKAGQVIKRITYYTDGKVEMERNFDANGKQHGVEKKYDYEDGSLKSELNYVHGKQVGKQVRYMNSNAGNFIETSYYNEAGKKDGEYSEIYAKNKAIKIKGQYVNDQKNGKWVYGDGKSLYKEENYENGKLIETNR